MKVLNISRETVNYLKTITNGVEEICRMVLPFNIPIPRFSNKDFTKPEDALWEVLTEFNQLSSYLTDQHDLSRLVMLESIKATYAADYFTTVCEKENVYLSNVFGCVTVDEMIHFLHDDYDLDCL